MNPAGIVVIVAGAAVAGGRLYLRRRRRSSGAPAGDSAGDPGSEAKGVVAAGTGGRGSAGAFGSLSGDMVLVAAREVHERVRAKAFRVVTLILLLVVAAAIVIPVLTKGKSSPTEVGVVGGVAPALQSAVRSAASSAGTSAHVASEQSLGAAKAELRSGRLDVVVVGTGAVYVKTAITASDSSTTAQFAQALAETLGVENAFRAAGVTPSQVARIVHARPVPLTSLERAPPAGHSTRTGSAILGIVLIFVMLNQYNTWTLIGVMEEKSSRVVEVLLATVKPLQLLGGKVLGIGIVALAQAIALLGVGFALAAAVGSDILTGTTPLVLLASLLWLVLGYAFYCWVYAGVGAMAERQDQIQTLAVPLSIPMIIGYIVALTGAAGSGGPSILVKVLAYLPPTAPFDMPALVGANAVSWWQFLLSALISVASTVVVARVAAGVYRKAVLRTGRRVRWSEVFARA